MRYWGSKCVRPGCFRVNETGLQAPRLGLAGTGDGRLRLEAVCLAILLLSGCAGPTEPRPVIAGLNSGTVTLLDHGWHTDIGIPVEELSGPLAVFHEVFPNARSLVFSYGKQTFLMAPADDWSEY